MGRIQKNQAKIKGVLDGSAQAVAIPALIILVGILSFGFGRVSVMEDVRPSVLVVQADQAAIVPTMAPGGLIVASRRGSTYHYPWCSGARQMSLENMRWFASEDDAREAGYRPAKNCAGLE